MRNRTLTTRSETSPDSRVRQRSIVSRLYSVDAPPLPNQKQSVKDFLRTKTDRLEKAIGIQTPEDEREKWRRRRLRMTQRCGIKLSDTGTTKLSRTTLRRESAAEAELSARADVPDGRSDRKLLSERRALPEVLDSRPYTPDLKQLKSSRDLEEKESVLRLTLKGIRRVFDTSISGREPVERLSLPTPNIMPATTILSGSADGSRVVYNATSRTKAFSVTTPTAVTRRTVQRKQVVFMPAGEKVFDKEAIDEEVELAELEPESEVGTGKVSSDRPEPSTKFEPSKPATTEPKRTAGDEVAPSPEFDVTRERATPELGSDEGDGFLAGVLGPGGVLGILTGEDDIRQQKVADKWSEHRPYFTYWVTTVQTLVTLFALVSYGFGPFGLYKAERSAMVMTTALALEAVDFYEPSSFWLGPRAHHLVHLGAKYTPCMRSERRIQREIEQLREHERHSACCIRNDGSGCVQATQDACSQTISRWLKWPDAVGNIGGWTGGSVCGLDPRYCRPELSSELALLTWNRSDITTWPGCENSLLDHYDAACRENGTHCNALALTAEPHMACELIGRPCCYGIRGQCRLATRDFCDFVQGYYHEDAFLCSQVSCLENVCGMMPFLHADKPDQFYRLFTSLFLHAGLLHLVCTIVLQYVVMVNLETLCGWWRMAIIYLLSGISGNLVSAIFLPDVPEVGPSAAQFSLLALMLADTLGLWKLYQNPWRVLLTLTAVVVLFLVLGLLPWIDNFAQTFGFLSGLLLATFLMPYYTFGTKMRTRLVKWFALGAFIVMFTILIILFYFTPLHTEDCPACSWINCIPFTEDFCNDQNSYFFPKGYDSL